MVLKRPYIAILLPFLCAAIGAAVGASIVVLNRPQRPDDYLFALTIAGGGLGMLGLLAGFLCSLWLRGHIGVLEIIAVTGILVGIFGWFINGKGGRWDIANVFAIVFWAAVVTFAIRAIALIGNRQRSARGR